MKKIVLISCLLFASIFSIRSFFSTGFFPMHDDAQVARVIVMTRALKNGQFPVRIVSDLGYGYGYPIFNFYAPLPYYVGAAFHIIGFDALTATKLMIGLGVIVGTLAMYICSSAFFGVYGGIFSAIVFTYFPYRAVQLFVRGAIGEYWAVSLIPFVLYGFFLLVQKQKMRRGICIMTLSLVGIILSHTVFGYLAIGCIISMLFIVGINSLYKNTYNFRKITISLIIVLIASLGVTAFFWFPALREMSYTNVYKVIGKSADYSEHYICLSQLWDSPWGYGGSAPGCTDGMTFKLGKLHILFFFLSFGLWVFSKRKAKRIHVILTGILALTLILIFMTLRGSKIIWDSVPFSSFIQYPWRLLGPIGSCIALFVGFIFYNRSSRILFIVLFLCSSAIVLHSNKLFVPQYIFDKPVESYGELLELRWRASGVSDEYLPKDIKIPKNQSEIVKERITGNASVEVKKIKETEVLGVYEIIASEEQKIVFHMAYFPGWTYRVNGVLVKPNIVEGQPSVVLSTGNNIIEMRFENTRERSMGNWVSFVSIIGFVALLLYGKKIVRYDRYTRI